MNLVVTGFRATNVKDYFKHLIKKCTIPVVAVVLLIAIAIVGSLAGSVFFRAKSYAKLLPFETGDFSEEVAEVGTDSDARQPFSKYTGK